MAISGPSTYPLDAGHSAPSLKIGEQHMPLFAVIRDKLRERILSGEFTPGDRLIEGRLSDDMGVSRIPVREALRALAAEGLVTIEPAAARRWRCRPRPSPTTWSKSAPRSKA